MTVCMTQHIEGTVHIWPSIGGTVCMTQYTEGAICMTQYSRDSMYDPIHWRDNMDDPVHWRGVKSVRIDTHYTTCSCVAERSSAAYLSSTARTTICVISPCRSHPIVRRRQCCRVGTDGRPSRAFFSASTKSKGILFQLDHASRQALDGGGVRQDKVSVKLPALEAAEGKTK